MAEKMVAGRSEPDLPQVEVRIICNAGSVVDWLEENLSIGWHTENELDPFRLSLRALIDDIDECLNAKRLPKWLCSLWGEVDPLDEVKRLRRAAVGLLSAADDDGDFHERDISTVQTAYDRLKDPGDEDSAEAVPKDDLWHDAGESPPEGFKCSLNGSKTKLADWILPESDAKYPRIRQLDKKLSGMVERDEVWCRCESERRWSIWFRNIEIYAEYNAKRLREIS